MIVRLVVFLSIVGLFLYGSWAMFLYVYHRDPWTRQRDGRALVVALGLWALAAELVREVMNG